MQYYNKFKYTLRDALEGYVFLPLSDTVNTCWNGHISEFYKFLFDFLLIPNDYCHLPVPLLPPIEQMLVFIDLL